MDWSAFTHLKAGDGAVFGHFQCVAEEGRPAELFHQGCCKLGKGVADQDDLGEGAELIQELSCAGERLDLCDGILDLFEAETVLLQDAKSPIHQLVVVRLITRRAFQLGDPAGFRKCDPDLGNQYAFYIKTSYIHYVTSFFLNKFMTSICLNLIQASWQAVQASVQALWQLSKPYGHLSRFYGGHAHIMV